MKRDWDLLRNLLINVEEERDLFSGLDDGYEDLEEEQQQKEYAILLGHLELLTTNGFIKDVEVLRTVGGFAGMSLDTPYLTMAGHDLLDTIRSATIWESIKATAKKKGIELSFEAVKVLSVAVLKHLVG